MIVFRASSELRQTFDTFLDNMKFPVQWAGIFVIENDRVILRGASRSLVFSFATKQVTTELLDIRFREMDVKGATGNLMLTNSVNMILYIFGRWGSIKLKVDRQYEQLQMLFNIILKSIGVEVSFSPELIAFSRKGVKLSYEDVLELCITPPMEDIAEEEKDHGLWHDMRWKKKDIDFPRIETTVNMRLGSRLGNNFYSVGYLCNKCNNPMFMTIFPPADPFPIETTEGRVLLARTCTCDECNILYTPTPGRLMCEGSIYEMDFGDDHNAYMDYIALLGKRGTREPNSGFNRYADGRDAGVPERDMPLDEACLELEELSEEDLERLNSRVDEGFYPDEELQRHSEQIEEINQKRAEYRKQIDDELEKRRAFRAAEAEEAAAQIEAERRGRAESDRQAQDSKTAGTAGADSGNTEIKDKTVKDFTNDSSGAGLTGLERLGGKAPEPVKEVVELKTIDISRRTEEEPSDTMEPAQRQGRLSLNRAVMESAGEGEETSYEDNGASFEGGATSFEDDDLIRQADDALMGGGVSAKDTDDTLKAKQGGETASKEGSSDRSSIENSFLNALNQARVRERDGQKPTIGEEYAGGNESAGYGKTAVEGENGSTDKYTQKGEFYAGEDPSGTDSDTIRGEFGSGKVIRGNFGRASFDISGDDDFEELQDLSEDDGDLVSAFSLAEDMGDGGRDGGRGDRAGRDRSDFTIPTLKKTGTYSASKSGTLKDGAIIGEHFGDGANPFGEPDKPLVFDSRPTIKYGELSAVDAARAEAEKEAAQSKGKKRRYEDPLISGNSGKKASGGGLKGLFSGLFGRKKKAGEREALPDNEGSVVKKGLFGGFSLFGFGRKKDDEEDSPFARKARVDDLYDNALKNTRAELLDLKEKLETEDPDGQFAGTYIEEVKGRIMDMDRERMEELTQSLPDMSTNAQIDAYKDIMSSDMLPELKEDILGQLGKRIMSIKTKESELLCQKLMKEFVERGIIEPESHHYYMAKQIQEGNFDPKEQRIMEKAIATYGGGLEPFEYPVLIVDTSRSGNGKSGMMLTPDHIFLTSLMSRECINIWDVEEIEFAGKLFGKSVNCIHSDGKKTKLPYRVEAEEVEDYALILSEFLDYLKTRPDSRSLDYLSSSHHNEIICFRCGHTYFGGGECPVCGYRENQ